MENQTCRECGCTDNDCRQCIEKTGHPCAWVEPNLCSACLPQQRYVEATLMYHFPDEPEREFKMTFGAYVTEGKEGEELNAQATAQLAHIGWPEAVINDIPYVDAPEPEPVPGPDGFNFNDADDPDYHDFEVVE